MSAIKIQNKRLCLVLPQIGVVIVEVVIDIRTKTVASNAMTIQHDSIHLQNIDAVVLTATCEVLQLYVTKSSQ